MPGNNKLAGFHPHLGNFTDTRDLTSDELAKHSAYTPIAAEARERLKLFRILDINYKEWKDYVNDLLSVKPRTDDKALHLDRLLMNYVACAYAIENHFRVSYQRRFRKDADKQKQYADFLNSLYTKAWATGFLLDFRGYIQHCGLGIGRFKRRVRDDSIKLTVTCDAADLTREVREWKRSKLTAGHGTLKIIPLMKQCHFHMLQSYGAFVANAFFPELKPAAEFYSNLTKELQERHPGYRMIFLRQSRSRRKRDGSISRSMHYTEVPNDLLRELGITAPTSL